ncbi:MAG: NYN domain-containing protein [Chloroflexi bacterium]|nr:NYN domain-containing protein [Chloroflexota bacterium]
MGKNVAVFVDVANIFYAAKAAGVDIDYVTLLKAATAGRDLVRAYAYTGLDPDNENQRNFHDFLRRHGYKVVSKDIRKYGDGKVKANLDIELVVDMMKTARNLDIAIVISGDGDFAPAIRAVQEMGVRCEVISFRGNTSSDLIEVADLFTEITHVARVEKGSSRSGRRVADDEDDLSMTEVPDKQSEGSGAGRGRGGRGRGRGRAGEAEPVAATSRSRIRSDDAPARAPRTRTRTVAEPVVAALTATGAPIVVLPGEKLSRVAPVAAPAASETPFDVDGLDDEAAMAEGADGADGAETPDGGPLVAGGEEARRRRRRRGGRGRGRGRVAGDEPGVAGEPRPAAAGRDDADIDPDADEDAEDAAPAPAPARRAGFAFGSVWDSQIGMPSGAPVAASGSTPAFDDEDLDEPPIPEYLIAERRQRDSRGRAPAGGGRGGAGRGVRAGYAAAIDRERFGGGRGQGVSRFAEPAPRGGRPDDRPRDSRPPRNDDRFRSDRPDARPAPRGTSSEPWSEVPPEIEAMLRAQLTGSTGTARPARQPRPEAQRREAASPESEVAMSGVGDPFETGAPAPATRPAGRRSASAAPAPAFEAAAIDAAPAVADAAAPAPKRRTTRRAAASEAPASEAPTSEAPASEAPTSEAPTSGAPAPDGVAKTDVEAAPPKRRAPARKAAPAALAEPEAPATEAAAPKRRTTRKKADAAEG